MSPQHLPGRRGHARPVLRRRFTGQPEHVVNYFFFVAEEVRNLWPAWASVSSMNSLAGADLLEMNTGIEHWKAQGLDYSRIFHQPKVPKHIGRLHTEGQDPTWQHARSTAHQTSQARP